MLYSAAMTGNLLSRWPARLAFLYRNTAGMLRECNRTFLVILLFIVLMPAVLQSAIINLTGHRPNKPDRQEEKIQPARFQLEKQIKTLDRKLAARVPVSYYLVINSSSNEFSLHRGTKLIREGKCSTGSYILLKNGDLQQWMFKTPKGEFRIQGKTTSPVWKKPDWAFIEEGMPVPPRDHYTRFEYGVLGDYALSLGHGYLIHGTLYQRFIGLPVTHGCIRMNDEDLELVYNKLSIGSRVFIF